MTVNVVAIVIISDLVTLILSLATVIFAIGRTYGEITADIKQMRSDISKIEGMFVVRIRDEYIDKK